MTSVSPRRKLATLVGLVIVFLQSYSHGQIPADPQSPPASSAAAYTFSARGPLKFETKSGFELFYESIDADLHSLPGIIIDRTREIVLEEKYQWPLLLAGGASVVLHNSGADRRMEKDIRANCFLKEDSDKAVDFMGNPGSHFAITGIWYGLAASNNDTVGKNDAWTMLKALSITGSVTITLKLIRDNDTPNGKCLAWPSGHTSSSFTVAAVLDELYGPEVGTIAYLGAGFVGYRMMESGDHWPSDVLFGAVLGYIVGHHVAGDGGNLEIAGFDVVPYADIVNDQSVSGIALTKTF